jgi:hypothetical protein
VTEEEETDDTPAEGTQKPAAPVATSALDNEAAELLHASINNAHDFVGGCEAAIPTPLVCIKVPDVPNVATDHIDRNEQARLAAEFIDWLLTGNRDGALLRRKALSVESERDYRKTSAT